MKNICYLALIRGINVGGKNIIKMDELKSIFVNMKFSDVETYIQSGNVLFNVNEKNRIILAKKIEETLSDKLNSEIKIVILTFPEIEEVINGIPKDFGKDKENYKYDVIFFLEPLTPRGLMSKIQVKHVNDNMYEGNKTLYIKRFAGKLTGSYISEILKVSQNITVRNLNTTKRLYELMLERQRKIE